MSYLSMSYSLWVLSMTAMSMSYMFMSYLYQFRSCCIEGFVSIPRIILNTIIWKSTEYSK